MLHGQGLVTELLLRKDGGKAGYIEDMRNCVGMEVRVCTGGGQSQKRAGCSTGCSTGQAEDWRWRPPAGAMGRPAAPADDLDPNHLVDSYQSPT